MLIIKSIIRKITVSPALEREVIAILLFLGSEVKTQNSFAVWSENKIARVSQVTCLQNVGLLVVKFSKNCSTASLMSGSLNSFYQNLFEFLSWIFFVLLLNKSNQLLREESRVNSNIIPTTYPIKDYQEFFICITSVFSTLVSLVYMRYHAIPILEIWRCWV